MLSIAVAMMTVWLSEGRRDDSGSLTGPSRRSAPWPRRRCPAAEPGRDTMTATFGLESLLQASVECSRTHQRSTGPADPGCSSTRTISSGQLGRIDGRPVSRGHSSIGDLSNYFRHSSSRATPFGTDAFVVLEWPYRHAVSGPVSGRVGRLIHPIGFRLQPPAISSSTLHVASGSQAWPDRQAAEDDDRDDEPTARGYPAPGPQRCSSCTAVAGLVGDRGRGTAPTHHSSHRVHAVDPGTAATPGSSRRTSGRPGDGAGVSPVALLRRQQRLVGAGLGGGLRPDPRPPLSGGRPIHLRPQHRLSDDTCRGRLWWNKDRKYKNAITNELFLTLAAACISVSSTGPLPAGRRCADAESLRAQHDRRHSIVDDGLTPACANNGGTTWTYDQGVILGGLAALARISGRAPAT